MRKRIATTAIVLAVVLPGTASAVDADTVHMKNGRMIHTSSARVDGDRVVLLLFEGEVAIPLDEVERIVENDEVERSSRAVEPDALPTAEGGSDNRDAASGPGGDGNPGIEQIDAATGAPTEAGDDPDTASSVDPTEGDAPEDEPEPDPRQTPAYWRERLAPLQDELARIDTRLRDLRSRNGADVQAQIGRVETRRTQVLSELDNIRREARRLRVPSGWLR